MAIRSFRFLLAALPALSLGCAQGGQTYDDGSDGVNSSTDGEDDDVADDDVTDDDDAADDDTSFACSELNNAVYDALSSAADELDKSCMLTSDCQVFEQSPSCVDGCGTRFVANQSSADLGDVVAELEDTVCRDFDDAGCEVVPTPCPGDARVGECIAGQCQLVGESAFCDDIQADVVTARDAAVAEVDTSCEQDEDCESLGSQPRCLATCGGSLALGNADASMLDTAISEIEDTLCRQFDQAGCVVVPPPCDSPPIEVEYEPRCVDNECAYVDVLTADQCADLSRQAEVFHQQVVMEAETSCETVDDCALVPNALECADGCLPPIGVNVTDEARVRAEMADGVENICMPFSNLACDVSTIDCTTDAYETACLDGRCVAEPPTEVGTADQCSDLVQQGETLYDELIAEADTTCETVDDCAVVLHSPPCALSCTLPIAVNLSDEGRLRSEMTSGGEAICTLFDELACLPVPFDCLSNEHQPECLDGRCVAQLPTDECYAPDQNLDLAYSGTIAGCPCSDEGSICILPVGLDCSDGAWQAVEDGPCSPDADESSCDGRVDSPMDCVDLFETCFELSTGGFCGVGHTTELCPDGMIVQSSADCLQDDATCVELDNGLYCTG